MAELWSDGVASWSRPISCWFGMPSFWLFTFGMIFGHQQPMFVLSSKCSFPRGSKNQWHSPREAIHCKPIPVEPMADPNAPDAIVAADEESAYQWPARHQLASCWEENGIVRQNLRDTGRMLLWPNRDLTGIATLAALSSNRVLWLMRWPFGQPTVFQKPNLPQWNGWRTRLVLGKDGLYYIYMCDFKPKLDNKCSRVLGDIFGHPGGRWSSCMRWWT